MKKQMCICVPEEVYRILKQYPNMSAKIVELVLADELQPEEKKKYHKVEL